MEGCKYPEFAILDGGFATECVRHGHIDIDNDPLWSARLLVTNPDTVYKVHMSFLKAGSNIILTNTYQAGVDNLIKHLDVNESDALALVKKAAEIAIQAKEDFKKANPESTRTILVAGSVGPYGACLHDGSEYTGDYVTSVSSQVLKDWHRPRLEALLNSGVDIIAMETIPAQKEAEVLVSLLQDYPSANAWISFSCKDGGYTYHGEKIQDAVNSISECSQVIGIGINCTSPQHISPLLESIDAVKHNKIIVIYPNSGEEWTSEKRWHGKERCQPLHEYATDWIKHGAKWIGGCCRTTAIDISKLVSLLNDTLKK